MKTPLTNVRDAEQEIAAASYPLVRLLQTAYGSSPTPRDEVKAEWLECTPASAAPFSAVGYFFARDLHKKLNVPVGVICCARGSVPGETYIPAAALEANPLLKPIMDRYRKAIENYPGRQGQVPAGSAAAPGAVRGQTQRNGRRQRVRPRPLPPLSRCPLSPSRRNSPATRPSQAMRRPVSGTRWPTRSCATPSPAPPGIRARATPAAPISTARSCPCLIQEWRKAWGQGDFPFLIVQLPNMSPVKDQPGPSPWAELREAQAMALSQPNTAMVVTIDIGEAESIHPKNKQDVGARLCLAALKLAYGRDVLASGPVFDGVQIEGGKARLKFKNVGQGLAVRGDGPLKGFAIAGADRRFVWADARIEGDTIVVTSDRVPQPTAVRYAWADNPICNLFNKDGLPASPFRTDDWPGVTDKAQ